MVLLSEVNVLTAVNLGANSEGFHRPYGVSPSNRRSNQAYSSEI